MNTIRIRGFNRLQNNASSGSFRPSYDGGYDQLIERLFGCLQAAGSENPPMRAELPVHMLLRTREYGYRLSPVTFQRGMQRALIINASLCYKNRKYQFCETYHAGGLLSVFGQIMVCHKQHSIYNLELAKEMFVLRVLMDHETIITSLLLQFPLEEMVVELGESPNWLVILTNLGRLLVMNLRNGELLAQYLLPSHEVKFNSMYPNEANRSFSVYGQLFPVVRNSESRRGQSLGREYVIAMFNIYPLTFNGMFKMPKAIFGEVVNVNVIGDMVIVFRKKPHEFTHTSYQPGEFSDGNKVLPFSIFITEEPQICSRIEGNWSTLEYSGFPYHFLGTPSNCRYRFKLMDAAQRKTDAEIEMPEHFCDRPVDNRCLIIDDTPMFFLADESGRILRFEDHMLVSYDFRKCDGRMKITKQWKTSIWATEDFLNNSVQVSTVMSRSGRRITPSQDFIPDYRLTIKGVEYSPDLQMLFVAALCDLHAPVFDDPLRPYDLVSRRNAYMDESDLGMLAYCIDATTGRILKASLMRSSCLENIQFQLDALDAGLTFLQRGRQMSLVEVQRLQEVGVKEWEQPNNKRRCYTLHGRSQRVISSRNQTLRAGQHDVRRGNMSRNVQDQSQFAPQRRRRQRRRFGDPYYFDEENDEDWDIRNANNI
uniref:Uncharacterized protein n=1 Tax=Syphacia muris TaxID=451379 RepID=A0A0N5AAI7_9BILA